MQLFLQCGHSVFFILILENHIYCFIYYFYTDKNKVVTIIYYERVSNTLCFVAALFRYQISRDILGGIFILLYRFFFVYAYTKSLKWNHSYRYLHSFCFWCMISFPWIIGSPCLCLLYLLITCSFKTICNIFPLAK